MATTLFNDVAVTGIASGFKYDPKEQVMHFSIKNEDGMFYIKAYDLENIRLCEQLTAGQTVSVLGELHSFIARKCHSHHIYIRVKTLIPFDDSPALKQLVTLAGIQALYEAKSRSNGYQNSSGGALPMEPSR